MIPDKNHSINGLIIDGHNRQKSMSTIIKHLHDYPLDNTKVSVWKKFIAWCDEQEKNRLGWMITAIALHVCVLTIFTLFAIILSGNHFIFWPFAISAMVITLIVNLAAMPTRITIPVFFFTVIADLIIVINCAIIGFDIRSTMI